MILLNLPKRSNMSHPTWGANIIPKPKRAALYVWVSATNRATRNQAVFEQNLEDQELPLRRTA